MVSKIKLYHKQYDLLQKSYCKLYSFDYILYQLLEGGLLFNKLLQRQYYQIIPLQTKPYSFISISLQIHTFTPMDPYVSEGIPLQICMFLRVYLYGSVGKTPYCTVQWFIFTNQCSIQSDSLLLVNIMIYFKWVKLTH